MNRKKFLKASLATLGLGLVFPSLIRGAKDEELPVITEINEHTSSLPPLDPVFKASQGDYIRRYPMTPDECFIALRFHNFHDKIDLYVQGQRNGGDWNPIFQAKELSQPEGVTDGVIMIEGYQVTAYDTIRIRYNRVGEMYEVAVYIPSMRLIRNGHFDWELAMPVKNSGDTISLMHTLKLDDQYFTVMEGPLFENETRFVVERSRNRIEIYLI